MFTTDPIPVPLDAITLLTADHGDIAELFARYRRLVRLGAQASERQQLAREICSRLRLHACLETDVFYLTVRQFIEGPELDEALVEHQSAEALMAQIETCDPRTPRYDACVKVLADHVEHHMREEEELIFPALLETRLDLDGLGERLVARRLELLAGRPSNT